LKAYLKAMRPERWPRSLAIFLGCATYFFIYRDALHVSSLPVLAWRALAAFALTWGISTANYIINEIVDLPFDIHHPTKRFRPLVSGDIKKIPFSVLGLVLIIACFGLAYFFFSVPFFLSLLGLLAAGFVYNVKPIRTKDIPFLDAISESVNNPLRFLIGWYAFAPEYLFPPVSLLLSWWAFGNFLMVAKRLSEFRFLKEKAGNYRISHKRYTKNMLMLGMTSSAVIGLLAFLYFAHVFRLQTFFFIAPFLVVFFLLIFRKTLREAEVMEEPEKLLARPLFALYTIFLVSLFILSFFMDTIGR